MAETILEELKRCVHFGAPEEKVLRRFSPEVVLHLEAISAAFYRLVREHPQAMAVFVHDAQLEGLRDTLREWLDLLFRGPWDEAYFERRASIGRAHGRVALPQHHILGAMSLIRGELMRLTERQARDQRLALQNAVNKILDLELAMLLSSHRQDVGASVQHQLSPSEARYDEIVEKTEALISTADQAGCVVLFNTKCEQMTGLSRTEARGRSWVEMFVAAHDREEVARLLRQVAAGHPPVTFEGPLQTTSARARQVRWQFTALQQGTTPALCAVGIDVGQDADLVTRTSRTERLAALGVMAAGLAHEIRNPLNSAHLQLNVARRRLDRAGAQARDHVAHAIGLAEAEMNRLAAFVRDFLQFAKPQALRLSQLDLPAAARTVVEFLEPEATARAVHVQLESSAPCVIEADENLIMQGLLHLVRNAIEASKPDGHVTIRLRQVATLAEITVEDDGPGWGTDAPIFEPFFTTKDKGTGLGLAIVHRIVVDHSGTLDAKSRPGHTTFTIRLPRACRSTSLHPERRHPNTGTTPAVPAPAATDRCKSSHAFRREDLDEHAPATAHKPKP